MGQDLPISIKPRLISLRGAALILDTSEKSVRRLIAKGLLGFPVKVGGSTKLVVEEVDSYVARIIQEAKAKYPKGLAI